MIAVAAVLSVAGLAGPAAAGTIGSYPALSAALVLLIRSSRGTRTAAHALTGLVRGLPGYLTFCLAITMAAPLVGMALAVPLSLAACVATYGLTWRAVRSPTKPAPSRLPHWCCERKPMSAAGAVPLGGGYEGRAGVVVAEFL